MKVLINGEHKPQLSKSTNHESQTSEKKLWDEARTDKENGENDEKQISNWQARLGLKDFDVGE